MSTTIVQTNNPVLRKKAKEIPIDQIKTSEIKSVVKDMKMALDGESDGVAIAAPQIDYQLRIFVVSGKIFDQDFIDGKKINEKNTKEHDDLVFINPQIIKISKTKKWLAEGCLSVRWIYGECRRSTHATVTAYDENGNKFTKVGTGLLAHIFQHEIDHLDGTLFIDTARNLEEHRPEEMARNGKNQ